jgi:hypothetical protein
MMRLTTICAILICWLTNALGASASENTPLGVMPPNGFTFNGTWDCAGKIASAKHVHKSTYTGGAILDGKWIELTEEDVEPTSGYLAKYLIGYDIEQKRLVEFDANNFGAAIYYSQEGWQNRVLTLTSPVSENEKIPYVANRFLYAITGPNEFIVDWQISKSAALKWIPSDHLVCERRGHQ